MWPGLVHTWVVDSARNWILLCLSGEAFEDVKQKDANYIYFVKPSEQNVTQRDHYFSVKLSQSIYLTYLKGSLRLPCGD